MINFYDDLGLNKNQITQVSLEVLSVDPTATVDKYQGRIIFTQAAGSSATDGTLSFYNGTDWVNIDGSGGVTSVLAASVGVSTGSPLVVAPVAGTGTVTLRPMAYDGGTDVGFVPSGSGGTATLYLNGAGNWTTPSGTGGGTMSTFEMRADSGLDLTIDDTYVIDIAGGTVMDTVISGSNPAVITVNHDAVTSTPATTTPAQLAFGGTFPAITITTVDAQGHTTDVNTATYTLPAAPTVAAYTLITNPATPTAGVTALFANGSAITGQLTLTGTANEVTVTAAGTSTAVYTSSLSSTLITPGSLQVSTTFEVDTTSIFTGIATFTALPTIPAVPSASTDAASKGYVDSVLVGALIFQGGYDASTNTPDLTSSPNSIKKGWTYAVTTAGNASGFWTTSLEIGDVVIAEIDNPTTIANWTDVQNNIELATAASTSGGAVKGITSFNSDSFVIASGWTGLKNNSVSGSYGDATQTTNITLDTYGVVTAASETLIDIPASQVNNFTSSVETIISADNHAELIGNGSLQTFTVNHQLDTRDVIVQVVENASPYATIFAQVSRSTVDDVVITFSTVPASGQYKVLVTKIA